MRHIPILMGKKANYPCCLEGNRNQEVLTRYIFIIGFYLSVIINYLPYKSELTHASWYIQDIAFTQHLAPYKITFGTHLATNLSTRATNRLPCKYRAVAKQEPNTATDDSS